MIAYPQDRRCIARDQIVRVREDAREFQGLWMVVKDVDDDYLTGLIFVEGDNPVLTRVPRASVESAIRAFLRSTCG